MSAEKELKDQRIPIMMSNSELTALDDWSFKNRIRSRGEAIRRLIHIGLEVDQRSQELFEQSDSALKLYRRRSDDLLALFSDPQRSPKDVATAAAEILPELLSQLKALSIIGMQTSIPIVPFQAVPDFEDAQELGKAFRDFTDEVDKHKG